MSELVTPSCDLLAYGDPTHAGPVIGLARNELFAQLAEHGFRSIALETDRVAALTVNDFVQEGSGTLDTVMRAGFSHGFGDLDHNRQLVAWLREYNARRPPEERLSFHGFDAAMETMSVPSPRRYLEHARDYLGLDVDLACDDETWSRTEAVLDATKSPGATPEADRLRVLGDDLLVALHARAPELIAATSRADWFRAKTHLTAGLGLLRYHKQSAERVDESTRVSRLSGVRDVLMAENLLDIRLAESGRGATFVHAATAHLHLARSRWQAGDLECVWYGAGSIVSALAGERYRFTDA
ncbi:erythromycin esterase family protein [Actinophytocola algeriensis]|uniref:Erythromycin esterase-like protein n=1 Tax=Actinophytocola algeriensis TaxID=1768010 RepID=A0A7W7VDM3_9PSEU|nr:erythromycin esterase family protein [Actinophytocola algeriensis]MBB4906331.1 erythromycin esterase-like protein [Actinophytocola algeriensis]MBE1477812.1 erythromycin esterase-like protein [Actinophytocola algeriensis]